jgi:flagellar motor switch protein FliN/FliY
VVASVHYLHGLTGDNVLIIKERDAVLIAGLMMGDPNLPPQQLDEISLSAVAEAMNQMIGSAATAMSNLFGRFIDISPPEVVYRDLAKEDAKINGTFESEPLVQVSFSLHVESLLDSELIQLLPVGFARQITGELMALLSVPYPASSLNQAEALSPAVMQGVAREPQPKSGPQPPAREKFPIAEEHGSFIPLDLIRDISVRISGVFGRRMLTIKELLSLTSGAVVELDCLAADPLEILANGKLVARGEVVLVGDNYGLKITEIVKPWLGS